jgi:hypothetical protein
MKRFFAALILSAAMLLCSCTAADIIVSASEDVKNRFPQDGGISLTVNISSGTFHIDGNCRYAVKIKEENRKIIYYSEIKMALADGYKPCSACAAEYKNTEDHYG